jgi:inner membrane protein
MLSQGKNSVFLKALIIGFLMLVLLIPSAMIGELVNERQQRRDQAVDEVGVSWGGRQVVAGPILSLPYKKLVQQDGKAVEQIEYAHFLPETLAIKGQVMPEMRQRGIYQVAVYGSELNFAGSFAWPDMEELGIKSDKVVWSEAVVSIGISDMRGIKEEVAVTFAGQQLEAKPGLGVDMFLGGFGDTEEEFKMMARPTQVAAVSSGFNSRVGLNQAQGGPFDYAFSLSLNGSQGLDFLPVAGETAVELLSSWPSPKFAGAFLPDERTVEASGFKAKWKVLQLNRSFPQSWVGASDQGMSVAAFGVDLLIPVDEYQKNARSTKYAILFIALTFLVFFFSEMMNKVRIHPMHYLLVGLALVLFFSLLLSITEHLGFNLAYLIASLSTIAMVGFYSRHILMNNKLSFLQTGIMILVYGFIFAILQLEDYALLAGSIGLFVILAIVMFISRKIDWYGDK